MRPYLRPGILVLYSLLTCTVFAQGPEPLRTWKDITGGFSIQATFLKLTGDLVILERPGKPEVSLPLAQLSAADQQYVRARQAELQRYLSARVVKPGDNLAAIIASARTNSVIKLTAGTFQLRPRQPQNYGVLIENKRGLIITGAGRDKTTIKLSTEVDVGFLIGNQVEDLKIENLHIQGSPPLKTNTAGIGSTSLCSDVRNVILTNLRVDQVAVGIFMATNKGPVRDVQITHNIITDTHGTEAGWGYGIHTRKISNVLIAHNYIEHATRHSIYVRESPRRSRLIVEDNFVLNHDLRGKNPRWYCAALNCPENRATTRIAHNYFLNPNAVGIAIMTSADDLSLINNQIIGEHYVGIWPVTGQTHTALGNSVVLHAQPAHPQWSHKISSFDWPNGKETNSRLVPPNAKWQKPDHVCQLDGQLYVMKDGTLDEVTPGSWEHRTSPTTWTKVRGMCAVKNVRASGAGRIYVVTDTAFIEVDPKTWETREQAGDWTGTRFTASTTNQVHILKGGTLHSVDLASLAVTQDQKDWTTAQWMCAWGNRLYLFDGQAHHRVTPKTFETTLVSQPKTP
ncbi:MAG: right-handed parallel beta-helix repeat-containing protein [Pirellulaceae bacterium]